MLEILNYKLRIGDSIEKDTIKLGIH